MNKYLAFIKEAALFTLFPKTCYHCNADLKMGEGGVLCQKCAGKVVKPGPLICKRCGAVLKYGGAFCYDCRGAKARAYKCRMVRSAVVFNEPVRSLVHAFKYNGHTHIADYFSSLLLNAFKENKEFGASDIIVPVPLHRLRRNSRGYNQSALLARRLAGSAGVGYGENILIKTKRTKSQAKLKKAQRRENVRGAFEVKQDVKGKVILLIDDVATTTMTLEACAAALKEAGAKRVYALTLAREI